MITFLINVGNDKDFPLTIEDVNLVKSKRTDELLREISFAQNFITSSIHDPSFVKEVTKRNEILIERFKVEICQNYTRYMEEHPELWQDDYQERSDMYVIGNGG